MIYMTRIITAGRVFIIRNYAHVVFYKYGNIST